MTPGRCTWPTKSSTTGARYSVSLHLPTLSFCSCPAHPPPPLHASPPHTYTHTPARTPTLALQAACTAPSSPTNTSRRTPTPACPGRTGVPGGASGLFCRVCVGVGGRAGVGGGGGGGGRGHGGGSAVQCCAVLCGACVATTALCGCLPSLIPAPVLVFAPDPLSATCAAAGCARCTSSAPFAATARTCRAAWPTATATGPKTRSAGLLLLTRRHCAPSRCDAQGQGISCLMGG